MIKYFVRTFFIPELLDIKTCFLHGWEIYNLQFKICTLHVFIEANPTNHFKARSPKRVIPKRPLEGVGLHSFTNYQK